MMQAGRPPSLFSFLILTAGVVPFKRPTGEYKETDEHEMK